MYQTFTPSKKKGGWVTCTRLQNYEILYNVIFICRQYPTKHETPPLCCSPVAFEQSSEFIPQGAPLLPAETAATHLEETWKWWKITHYSKSEIEKTPRLHKTTDITIYQILALVTDSKDFFFFTIQSFLFTIYMFNSISSLKSYTHKIS